MSKISFPRMAVLQALDSAVSGISPNRFVSTRPPAAGESMSDFILVRLSNTMFDRGDTYQSTKGHFAVFARDVNTKKGNVENTLRLEQMQREVMDLFPIVTDLFHAKMPRLVYGGPDGAGFHFLDIQFSITILK